MSRDSNGNYTLPAGNPVVTATTITSTWANSTLEDIADALTESLSRNGEGGMLAPLELTDGTVSAPSLTFSSDTNTGLYLSTTDTLGVTAGGVLALEVAVNTAKVSGTAPKLHLSETDASVENGNWYVYASTDAFHIAAASDAGSTIGGVWLTVERSDQTIDEIQLDATALDFNATMDLSGTANFQSAVTFASNVLVSVEGTLASPSVSIAADLPVLELRDNNAASNEKAWLFEVVAGDLTCVADTDTGGTPVSWLTVSRTGTTVDAIAFAGTAATLNGVELALMEATDFTITLTGYASGPTGTVQAQKWRNAAGTYEVVTLTAEGDISGTSNSTGFGATGIPAAYRPNSSAWPMCVVVDNSTNNLAAAAHVSSSGGITFLAGSPLSTTGFTGSGSKGLSAGWTITYGRAL